MAVKNLFYVLLSLFVSIHCVVSSRHTVRISPTNQSLEADGQQVESSLLDYIISGNRSAIFNTSNTTVEFLSGIHEIHNVSNMLIVNGVENVIWTGPTVSKATVHCMQEFIFVFRSVQNLTLSNIEINNCGFHKPIMPVHVCLSNILPAEIYDLCYLDESRAKATLAIVSALSACLTNVTIKASRGYGLLAVDIIGNSVIDSCVFANNNQEDSNLIGGNALIIFKGLKWLYKGSKYLYGNLTIQDSVFQNGSDNLNHRAIICHSSLNSSYYRTLHASGLGLVIDYVGSLPITLILINNVTFSMNTGKHNHPSVLIAKHDAACQITITNSTFIKDSPLRFISLGLNSTVLFTNNTFAAGVSTALDVCVIESTLKPFQEVVFNREYPPLVVKVDNCIFKKYPPIHTTSVFRLQQIQVSCPQFTIEIMNSTYKNNKMPVFLYETYQTKSRLCPTLTFTNCTFNQNHRQFSSSRSMVHMIGTKPRVYSLETIRGQLVDHVSFSHTTFKDNLQSIVSPILSTHNLIVSIRSSLFVNSQGSALHANLSLISFHDKNSFINNTGKKGGALSLLESRLYLDQNSHLILKDNRADYGGGIFSIPLALTETRQRCTLSFSTQDQAELNVSIGLINNSALFGDHLFYGAYENCYLLHFDQYSSKWLDLLSNSSLLDMVTLYPKPIKLYSLPFNLEICTSVDVIQTFPGATFNISAKVLPRISGTPIYAPVVVEARLCELTESLQCEHDFQNELRSGLEQQLVTTECSNLTYSVYSQQKRVYTELSITKSDHETLWIRNFLINSDIHTQSEVKLLPCPIGYQLRSRETGKGHCQCVQYLLNKGIECEINQGGTILVPNHVWVGFHQLHPENITIHTSCPFDYCIPSDRYISLSNPNQQCNYNHAGVLCGGCQANLSLALGSSQCKQCSNVYLLLIIPFALAGVALVILLLKCNLTVSTGHINGIIFYANIVHINKAHLFPKQDSAYVLFSTFIAWLNLDLGIESCFFESMDVYAKVWLQFVFPVYLWLMVGFIVILAHYSSHAGRLIGNNSVPVLATLFLLSYVKLLRSIIAGISFTFVVFEDGSFVSVWLVDGNIQFFSPKHTAFFLAALLFAFAYILPLTLLVLLAPCLQTWSHHKGFNWVNKIKPFLDAYQGPYTKRFRYWTGLMLVLRLVLIVIFSVNYNNDPSLSFFWIATLVGPIAMLTLLKNVYRLKFASYLESLSLLNLVLLASVSSLTTTTEYKELQILKEYVTYCSIAVTLLAFLSILIYPIMWKLHSQFRGRNSEDVNEPTDLEMTVRNSVTPTRSVVVIPPHTEERLTGPLLEAQVYTS